MCACIRERKESTRVKTRGQYDVAKARRGCRRVPTRGERKTGTNGLSIKENAIDGEGKGDRAPYSWRKSPMSSISRSERETKGIRGGKGENGENKRFIVGRTSSCAAKPLRGKSSERERVVRERCSVRTRTQPGATAATAGTRGRGGGKRR